MKITIDTQNYGATLRVTKHIAPSEAQKKYSASSIGDYPYYTCDLTSTSYGSGSYKITGSLSNIMEFMGMDTYSKEDEKMVCEYIVDAMRDQIIGVDPDNKDVVIKQYGEIGISTREMMGRPV